MEHLAGFLAGIEMLAISGGFHTRNGRSCRRLGYNTSGRTNIGLVVCWFVHHLSGVHQRSDRSLQERRF